MVFFNRGFIAILCLLQILATTAAVLPKRAAECTNPLQRKEWRKLTDAEKADYLKAVNCLQKDLKAVTSATVPGATTRFEDFIGVHKVQTPYVHFVGHFLPWHRLFMAGYERALREECGYQGAQPYWDYTLDTNSLLQSPVFDPKTGFGGGGGQCVTDGPFVDWVIHLPTGTGVQKQERCLSRALSPQIAQQWLKPEIEAQIKQRPDFGYFTLALEGDAFGGMGIHGGGHFAVGGSAGDVYTSNTEPLFYLHHTNMDRIWAQWQDQDTARLTDISGPIRPRSTFLGGGDAPLGNVTMDFKMNLGALNWDVTVGDIMNTRGGALCYEYV